MIVLASSSVLVAGEAMWINPYHQGARLVVLAFVIASVGSALKAQPRDGGEVARELLKQRPVAYLEAVRKQLVALGDPAIGPVIEELDDKENPPVRLMFLIGILAEIDSNAARWALATRLRDARPFVRAHSAIALGLTNGHCAIPALISLIGDSSEYARQVSTDPYTETPLSVGAAAAQALEHLTGLKPAKVGSSKHFRRYWEKHRTRFNCKGWTDR